MSLWTCLAVFFRSDNPASFKKKSIHLYCQRTSENIACHIFVNFPFFSFITASRAVSFIILVRLYSCSASFGTFIFPSTLTFLLNQWNDYQLHCIRQIPVICSHSALPSLQGRNLLLLSARLCWHSAIFCWLRYIQKDKTAQPAPRAQQSTAQQAVAVLSGSTTGEGGAGQAPSPTAASGGSKGRCINTENLENAIDT